MKPADFTVGWISALPEELAAAEGMLDHPYDPLPQLRNDDNAYTFGRIGKHNIVLACLPLGAVGITSAATVAEKIKNSFPSIKIGLMVGIGGGVPSAKNDIRLGDVVVSKPSETEGGVIQYDFGKTTKEGKFQRTSMHNRPPDSILGALSRLSSKHIREGHQIQTYVAKMVEKFPNMRQKYIYPGAEYDKLFVAAYEHAGSRKDCTKCDIRQLVSREARHRDSPEIFYGLIASGNQVMRHGSTRDRLSQKLGVLCFEMEAAGLMNRFPCLIIRGICDYADSHKNDRWQAYAAAVAAAYAKELLYIMPAEDVAKEEPIGEILEEEDSVLISDDPFMGRNKELNMLTSFLSPNASSNSQRIVIVSGLGDMGNMKLTTLSEKWCKESFSSILRFDARSEGSLRKSFAELATHIFNSNFLSPGAENDAIEQLRWWLSEKDRDRWLLIFESYGNAQIPGQESSNSYNIRCYFPYISQGAILVFTRSQRLDWEKLIQLKSLEGLEKSFETLINPSNLSEANYDPKAHNRVLQVDSNPLLLISAGYRRSKTSKKFIRLLRSYEGGFKNLDPSAEAMIDYDGCTLYSMWNISYVPVKVRYQGTPYYARHGSVVTSKEPFEYLLDSAVDGIAPPITPGAGAATQLSLANKRFRSTQNKLPNTTPSPLSSDLLPSLVLNLTESSPLQWASSESATPSFPRNSSVHGPVILGYSPDTIITCNRCLPKTSGCKNDFDYERSSDGDLIVCTRCQKSGETTMKAKFIAGSLIPYMYNTNHQEKGERRVYIKDEDVMQSVTINGGKATSMIFFEAEQNSTHKRIQEVLYNAGLVGSWNVTAIGTNRGIKSVGERLTVWFDDAAGQLKLLIYANLTLDERAPSKFREIWRSNVQEYRKSDLRKTDGNFGILVRLQWDGKQSRKAVNMGQSGSSICLSRTNDAGTENLKSLVFWFGRNQSGMNARDDFKLKFLDLSEEGRETMYDKGAA